MTSPPPQIRLATPQDLIEIRSWLKREWDEEGASFFGNISLIEAGRDDGTLSAITNPKSGRAVGFSLASGDTISILAIRSDLRGGGFGTALARHVIDAAERDGQPGVTCECRPKKSFDFWTRKMGFVQVEGPGDSLHVALPFRRSQELPQAGRLRVVGLQFFAPDSERLIRGPYEINATEADGVLHLETELVEHLPSGDVRAKVTVDGATFYSGKVKYGADRGFDWDRPWLRISQLVEAGTG